MPKIITCFKWVIDQADIKSEPGSNRLILDRVDYKISDYDRNAIEEAVRLQEVYGGSVAALNIGTAAARKSLKDALARGPEQAYFVHDASFNDLEPAQTASLLARALDSQIDYDLIICGEGSGDLYAQQVGPRLAENLNLPCITQARKLTIQENQVIAERKVEEGIEVVAAPMPCLVTVLPEINTPRIPGLKDTLAASKKPVTEISLQDLGQYYEPCLKTIDLQATTMERKCEKFDPADGLNKLAQALVKAAAIS